MPGIGGLDTASPHMLVPLCIDPGPKLSDITY